MSKPLLSDNNTNEMEMKQKDSQAALNQDESASNPAYVKKEKVESSAPERMYFLTDLINLSLQQVAREGDVGLMEKLLERLVPSQRKKKLNTMDELKWTPMHYAARYNQYKMIDFLIKNGADVQTKGEDNSTPLHYAAKYKKRNHLEQDYGLDDDMPLEEIESCIQILIKNGAQVNTRDSMGLTPLHLACTRGNTLAVRELLHYEQPDLEITDNQGMTALHLSCLYGKKKIVKLLLDAGANLRCKDKDSTTPLHLACEDGSIDIVRLLLDTADAEMLYNLNEKSSLAFINEGTAQNPSDSGLTTLQRKAKNVFVQNPSDFGLTTLQRKAKNGFLNKFKTPSSATMPSVEKSQNNSYKGSAELLQDVDSERNLPLHLCIENGHYKLVEFCVERAKVAGLGSMINTVRQREDSCLHLAVLSNSLDIVQYLVKEGADVDVINLSQTTPLLLSCQHNSHMIVKFLLENGANINSKDFDYMTPLIVASRYGHTQTINWLLEHNADVTETDKDDKNCLMWASEENRTDAIKLLLKNKTIRMMIEEKDRYSNTALHLAAMKGHDETVKLLLEHKAGPDVKNDNDRTTLHMAALYGHDILIPELVERDRSILNSTDEESNTALHLAAIGGNLKCVLILIQSGANIELRNARQWTPLDCAAVYGWEKVAKSLLEAGAEIQPKGKVKTVLFKVAPLLLACQRGHVDVVRILLKWKADVTFRAADGRNALDFAIDFSHRNCILVLIKHETWKLSMRNAVNDPLTGKMLTPMRKLIMKMEDMALIVCNQCVTDNGKKPENDDYAVTMLYELLDDMYSSTEWMERKEERPKIAPAATQYETLRLEDNAYAVYDEHDQLTPEAITYSAKSKDLQQNHPLQIMVSSKCEKLLLHPLITALLNYKWNRYGRYVYYINLLLYVFYLIVLNVYLQIIPTFYRLDWKEIIESRMNLSRETEDEKSCYFFSEEARMGMGKTEGCIKLSDSVRFLCGLVLALSVINLLREIFQIINQRFSYISYTNLMELTLYSLTFAMSLDFPSFSVNKIEKFINRALNATEIKNLDGFQSDTGLRQVWQQEIGAFSVFLSWMGLLLFIRKIPRIGIFVVMFTYVLKTFGEFLVVLSFFILGFSLSFTLLLGNQDQFGEWYEAIVKTAVMMIGELDYSDIFFGDGSYSEDNYTREVSFVLFVIFLFVMTILIMNLLVGLAVGDIIVVKEHATLETLGMQVALALEVEFTLPSFIRKKISLRKEKLFLNKYRDSNVIKRLLYENSNINLEDVTKAADKEVAEQEHVDSAEDKILSVLQFVRGKIEDILDNQSEVKLGVRGVTSLVRDARNETVIQGKVLKDNILNANMNLTRRIDSTRTGLTKTTQNESFETRGKVDGTMTMVNKLQEDLDYTKNDLQTVRIELQQQMESMQKTLVEKTWKDLEERLQDSEAKVDKTTANIMGNLEDLKVLMIKDKFVTKV